MKIYVDNENIIVYTMYCTELIFANQYRKENSIMKKYLAIGHWKKTPNATISVAMKCSSIKSFRENLSGNAFVPYVIITEKKLNVLETTDNLFDEVKKMTTNYRKWNHICDYIEQCLDTMRDKMSVCE